GQVHQGTHTAGEHQVAGPDRADPATVCFAVHQPCSFDGPSEAGVCSPVAPSASSVSCAPGGTNDQGGSLSTGRKKSPLPDTSRLISFSVSRIDMPTVVSLQEPSPGLVSNPRSCCRSLVERS